MALTMVNKSHTFLLILVAFMALGSACSNGDDDGGTRFVDPIVEDTDDDNVYSDDDLNDDTNDDVNDDIDDDDDSFVLPDRLIKSPMLGVRYYCPRILLTLDETIIDVNGRVLLDNDPLPWRRVQWLDIEEGLHKIDLYIGDELKESIEFEKRFAEATNIANEEISSFPAAVQLPEADGAMVPVRFVLENSSGQTCSGINLKTPEQPDFSSVQGLRQWLESETADLTQRDKAIYAMNFVERWVYFNAPPRSVEEYWRDHTIPDIFHSLGYGWCENHAKLYVSIAQMLGWSLEDTRINALEGHEAAEIKYDGGWHHFDVSSLSYYWDDEGRILPLRDIEGHNAHLILDYTDQFGYTPGGSLLELYVPHYVSTVNNENFEHEAIYGDDKGFVMETGDILELHPFGFGLFMCIQCDWDPVLTATGVLRRSIDNPDGASTDIHEPYPLLGLLLQFEATEPGDASINLTVRGILSEKVNSIDVSFNPGEQIDLSRYLDYKLLGEIHDIRIEFIESSVRIDKIIVEAFFQYSSRLTPQITHDQRQLIVNSDCSSLNFQLDVHDTITAISEIQFFTSHEGGVPDILNNAKALVAFGVNVLSGEIDWSSGYHIEVVSDHPADVEIIGLTASLDSLSIEPVISNWLGPDRFSSERIMYDSMDPRIGHQRIFWARSRDESNEDLGLVTFSLLIDGEERAQTQVNFVAE